MRIAHHRTGNFSRFPLGNKMGNFPFMGKNGTRNYLLGEILGFYCEGRSTFLSHSNTGDRQVKISDRKERFDDIVAPFSSSNALK